MTRKVRFFLIFQQIVLFCVLTIPSPGFSGDVTVGPGKFDHFRVSLPEKMKAGEEGMVRLEAVDAVNNAIRNFGESDREFRVAVSGSARVTPDAFKASSFVKGSFPFTIMDKTAEMITLSIKENNRFIPVLSQDIEILPNQLGHFLIQGPHTVQAGERFDLTVIGKDSFGNTVQEPISGGNIDLRFKGDAEPLMEKSSIPDFKSGATAITFISKRAGTVIVDVKDLITGSTGTSGTVEITHGPVSAFKWLTPKEVIAGELFEATLVSVDRFDNQVLNYASSGNGVQIATSGRQRPFPSTIPASGFSNGEAKIDLRYNTPEDMTLTALRK
ncbi:MAG: hypothetical protein HZA19_04295 [Nitrospirae bacterium]|nr:hypothetical protein [Nitrospirota bacterium]